MFTKSKSNSSFLFLMGVLLYLFVICFQIDYLRNSSTNTGFQSKQSVTDFKTERRLNQLDGPNNISLMEALKSSNGGYLLVKGAMPQLHSDSGSNFLLSSATFALLSLLLFSIILALNFSNIYFISGAAFSLVTIKHHLLSHLNNPSLHYTVLPWLLSLLMLVLIKKFSQRHIFYFFGFLLFTTIVIFFQATAIVPCLLLPIILYADKPGISLKQKNILFLLSVVYIITIGGIWNYFLMHTPSPDLATLNSQLNFIKYIFVFNKYVTIFAILLVIYFVSLVYKKYFGSTSFEKQVKASIPLVLLGFLNLKQNFEPINDSYLGRSRFYYKAIHETLERESFRGELIVFPPQIVKYFKFSPLTSYNNITLNLSGDFSASDFKNCGTVLYLGPKHSWKDPEQLNQFKNFIETARPRLLNLASSYGTALTPSNCNKK